MNSLDLLQTKPGTALVLSGGATKAFFFHLGVLKALPMTDITSIVGSSAGAIAGALLASGISPDRIMQGIEDGKVYIPEFDRWISTLRSTMLFRPRYPGILRQSAYTTYESLKFFASLPLLFGRDVVAEFMDILVNSQSKVSSFFSARALEDLVQSLLPSMDFRDLETDLYVIATDINNNRRAIFNPHVDGLDEDNHFMSDVPLQRAVRASASLPGLFEPVKIKDHYYVDGEIKRTLSADIGMRLADRVIVSHTYQPLHLPEGRSISDKGWWNIVQQSVYIVFQERIRVWERLYREQYPEKTLICVQPDPEDEAFFAAPQFTFRREVHQALIQSGEAAARRALAAANAE
ncbi:MAG: patatin-like phospholipase family protein [Anaerolineae bacterium]